jgi:hypothetical protein
MTRSNVYVILLAVFCSSSAFAQDTGDKWQRVFPRVHYFRPLIADVQDPRMALGLMQTNLFLHAPEGAERPRFELPDPEDSEKDIDVMAGIGGSIPLLLLKQWPGKGGIVASAQLGVFARFRMEYPTREDVGQDWYVGMPFEWAYEKWSGRFRIMHRSSHLGDELIETSMCCLTLRRIEFGGEFVDFLVARSFTPSARVYGGATLNVRSQTEYLPALQARLLHDRTQLQAGADVLWYNGANGHTGWAAGIDWQAQQRTRWRSMFSVAAGPALRTDNGATRLLLRYYHGPSAMGEFFLTPETFWSLEWVVDF